jgi:hypothetical protein
MFVSTHYTSSIIVTVDTIILAAGEEALGVFDRRGRQ